MFTVRIPIILILEQMYWIYHQNGQDTYENTYQSKVYCAN